MYLTRKQVNVPLAKIAESGGTALSRLNGGGGCQIVATCYLQFAAPMAAGWCNKEWPEPDLRLRVNYSLQGEFRKSIEKFAHSLIFPTLRLPVLCKELHRKHPGFWPEPNLLVALSLSSFTT
jgi:hypothetical protein